MKLFFSCESKRNFSICLILCLLLTFGNVPYIFALTLNSSGIKTVQTGPDSATLDAPVNIDYSESGSILTSDITTIKDKEIVMLLDSSSSTNTKVVPSPIRTPFDYSIYSETDLSFTMQNAMITGNSYTKGNVNISGENSSVFMDEVQFMGTSNTDGLGVGNDVTLVKTNEFLEMPTQLFNSFLTDPNYIKYEYKPMSYPSILFNPYLPGQIGLNVNKNLSSWNISGPGTFEMADVNGKTQIWYFSKDVTFATTNGVKGKGVIIADGDISFNGEQAINGDILVYSLNGSITITNTTNIKGFLYAPKGNVNLIGDITNLTGSIVAKNFNSISSTLNVNKSSIGFVSEKLNTIYTDSILNIEKKAAVHFVNQFTDVTGKDVKIHFGKYSKDANNNNFSFVYDMGTPGGRTSLINAINSITADTKYANLGDGLRRSIYTLNDTNNSNNVLVFTSGNVLGWTSKDLQSIDYLESDGNASYYGDLKTKDDTSKANGYATLMADKIKANAINAYFLNLSDNPSSTPISDIAIAASNASVPHNYFSAVGSTNAINASSKIFDNMVGQTALINDLGTLEVVGAYFNMAYPEGVEVTSVSNNAGLSYAKNPTTGNYEVNGYLQNEKGPLFIPNPSRAGAANKLKGDQAEVTVQFKLLKGESAKDYNKTFDFKPLYDSNGAIKNGYIKYDLKYTDCNGEVSNYSITKELPPLTINVTSIITPTPTDDPNPPDEAFELVCSSPLIVGDVTILKVRGVVSGKIYKLPKMILDSSNSNIVSINDDGIVIARSKGFATLSATIGNKVLYKDIDVYSDIH